LVEPLISAVYAADMEKLSVKATLSRFREMEKEHGSLIRAMRRQMKQRAGGKEESGARYSMFVTLSEGLGKLVEAIVARLPAESIRLNWPVARVCRVDGGWRLERAGATGQDPDPQSPDADVYDAVILAVPAYQAAGILASADAELAKELGQIEYSGTAIVSLGYRVRDVGHPLDGMGVVVPAVENSPILACSFSSRKYPHRAPEGTTLLRVFVGGARRPELAEMPDAQLLPLVLEHLRPLLRIRGEPVFCDIAHWPRTMPQYHVGHLERIARIEGRLAALPGLEMAGSAFRGVGVPDCIHSGQRAAKRILE
jgi:oxygen-dependent protoporphyrinogen oxidase